MLNKYSNIERQTLNFDYLRGGMEGLGPDVKALLYGGVPDGVGRQHEVVVVEPDYRHGTLPAPATRGGCFRSKGTSYVMLLVICIVYLSNIFRLKALSTDYFVCLSIRGPSVRPL